MHQHSPVSLSMLFVQAGRVPWLSPATLLGAFGELSRSSCYWHGNCPYEGQKLKVLDMVTQIDAKRTSACQSTSASCMPPRACSSTERVASCVAVPLSASGRGRPLSDLNQQYLGHLLCGARKPVEAAFAHLPLVKVKEVGREGARSRELWSAARAASSAAVCRPARLQWHAWV